MNEDTTCPTCGREDFKNLTAVKIHHTKSHGESIAGFEYDCSWCGDTVVRNTTEYKKAFCSDSCRDSWQSDNWSGEDNPNFQNAKKDFKCKNCGDIYTQYEWFEGRTKFCSTDCLGDWRSNNWTGEDSPVWKEVNAETEKFTTAERRQILERDNYTCQECGETEVKLNAHHINPAASYPKKAHDIDNGVTLCIDCHADRHDEPIKSFVLAQKN
jgi:endogenous inhibitor of DNA gyrase (YacG/DUF329 family)